MSAPPRHSPLMQAYLARREDLRRLFAARLGAAEAEDLVQELFLKVSAAGSPDQIELPDAYVFRLAYNLASDRRRASQRRGVRERRWALETFTQLGETAVTDAPSAERETSARREVEQVRTWIDALPPRAREVFILRRFEGLSNSEVAARLRISVSAVEQHMRRALSELVARRLR